MVHETPAWHYKTKHTVTLGYGPVHLLPHHVLGQWFCVHRETGRLLWDCPLAGAEGDCCETAARQGIYGNPACGQNF